MNRAEVALLTPVPTGVVMFKITTESPTLWTGMPATFIKADPEVALKVCPQEDAQVSPIDTILLPCKVTAELEVTPPTPQVPVTGSGVI